MVIYKDDSRVRSFAVFDTPCAASDLPAEINATATPSVPQPALFRKTPTPLKKV